MINYLFFLSAIIFFPFHDFHITHTTFHYNDESQSVEITIKVAIEDLEKSIKNKCFTKLDGLEDIEENKTQEKLITEYFKNNLTLLADKEAIEYRWVGKELSNNLHDIYLYFEIPNYEKKGNIKSITIKNTLFLDLYNYQTNIVLIELIDNKYNLTFTEDNDTQTVFINNKRQ